VSSRQWQQRVRDIHRSALAIQARTANLSATEFRCNETVIKAVLYDFLIIGEAARAIPASVCDRYPQIPWRLMGDMRNVISHEYFQVQIETVWKGVCEDIPDLIERVTDLMTQEGITIADC